MTWYMLQRSHGTNRPSRLIVTNRSLPRLDEIRHFHGQIAPRCPSSITTRRSRTDRPAPAGLKPGSLVINATGLGKDAARLAADGRRRLAREGTGLGFQLSRRLDVFASGPRRGRPGNLQIEDGWIYFIHGWTRVIAEVFHIDIPTSGPQFDELSRSRPIRGRCRSKIT